MKLDAKLTAIGRAISSEFRTNNRAEGVRISRMAVGTAIHASQRARVAKTGVLQELDDYAVGSQTVHNEVFTRSVGLELIKQMQP